MDTNKNTFLFFLGIFLISFLPSLAQENFVSIVNPVRGNYAWGLKTGNATESTKTQLEIIKTYDLPATWLVRYDTLFDNSIMAVLNNRLSWDEVGFFFEVTPDLADKAGVSYPTGGIFWHDANKIFLSGYIPEDRQKLIDTAFADFQTKYGFYPKSVGAWHVDAWSTEYMQKKYGITGVLICADQFSTDNYQIWGGWWGVPYYPSKFNILTPAQTLKNRLNVVVTWWATRDPTLGYGGSVGGSTYSVQVNDYQLHNFGTEYFTKLGNYYLTNNTNKFNQLTIGLENDMDWHKYTLGYSEQLAEISARKNNNALQVVTMAGFADWYRSQFTRLSPKHEIGYWLNTTDYRIGFTSGNAIRDLRIYNELWPEANLLTANPWPGLSLNNPYKIDSLRFPGTEKEPPSTINVTNLTKTYGEQLLPFQIGKWLVWLWLIIIVITVTTIISLTTGCLSLIPLILIGSASLVIPMIKSGLVYPYGMGFWGPNGHDGIWHVALIESLSHFSFNLPIMSGEVLKNYHFGFDLLLAIIHRLTNIPPVNLYFQIAPPILAVAIGLLTFKFVLTLTGSKMKAWWSTFFVYFGGSFGWAVGLFRDGKFGGESMFWANQSVSTLINPPYALSLVVILVGLLVLIIYFTKPTIKSLFVCSILFGSLFIIKIYSGIIISTSLLFLWIITLIHYRIKVKAITVLLLFTGIISLLLFLPFNHFSTTLLVFSPLWFPHTMLSFGDRFGWFKLEQARLTYFQSHLWTKLLLAEGLALVLFIIGNLGTRIIGFTAIKSIWQKYSAGKLIIFGLAISTVIPLLFIQKGNPWNTIQFFYYAQFFLAILVGITIGGILESTTIALNNSYNCHSVQRHGIYTNNFIDSRWSLSRFAQRGGNDKGNKVKFVKNRKVIKFIFGIIVIALTLPTTWLTLKDNYLPSRPPSRISIEELEALAFLKHQPPGVVLNYPFNPDWRTTFKEPKPLYAYETTAYISALSGCPSFLADEMNLTITNYQFDQRRIDSNRFFLTADAGWARQFVGDNKIRYIYVVKGQKLNLGTGDLNAIKVFENGEVVIYQVE